MKLLSCDKFIKKELEELIHINKLEKEEVSEIIMACWKYNQLYFKEFLKNLSKSDEKKKVCNYCKRDPNWRP